MFLLFTANIAFADNNLDSILIRLDQTILRHEIYKNAREARIRVLKEKTVNAAPVSPAAYQLNDSIFREYKSYMCDSAVHYLNKNVEIARKLHDREREYKSIFLLSSLLATAGMYQEAVDMLGDIRREQLPSSLIQDYYVCKEHVYREISGNSREPKSKRRYGDLSLAYRDSLLRILPEGVDKRIDEILPQCQPVYPHHLPGYRSGGQRHAAGRAATENPSATERGHSVPGITQKKK